MAAQNNNNNRQSLKNLAHMKEHCQIAKNDMANAKLHINLVESFILGSIKHEQEVRRKDDGAQES